MGWLIAALLGGYLFVNGQATPEKAAELTRQSLEKRYPGAEIQVDITGKSGKDVMKGRFKTVRLRMGKFVMQDLPFTSGPATNLGKIGQLDVELRDATWEGLVLHEANFSFTNVEYNLDQLKKTSQLEIVHCGPSTAKIVIQDAALQRLVGGKLKDVPDAHLLIEDGKFKIVGEKPVLGVGVPFEMTARPVGKGREVLLEVPNIKVGGLPLPGVATDLLMKDVNPVFVFDRNNKWPFSVDITNVTANDGRLEIYGNLPLKPIPTAAPKP